MFKGIIPQIDSAFPFKRSTSLFLGRPKNTQHRIETIKQHLQSVNIEFLIQHQHDEYLLLDKHKFGRPLHTKKNFLLLHVQLC